MIGAAPDASPGASADGPWSDAALAAALVALDPKGFGGIRVRARSGPVRDDWLRLLSAVLGPQVPLRRIAAGACEGRLSGGLDVATTLETGRLVLDRGLIAACDGGALVIAMAERLTPSAAATIGRAIDDGRTATDGAIACEGRPARFILVALDEGIEGEEALAAPLAERLGLTVRLDSLGWRDTAPPPALDLGRATALLPAVTVPEAMTEAFCAVASIHGGPSMRLPLYLSRAARGIAALAGRPVAEMADAAAALRLVLGLTLQATSEPETGESEEAATPDAPDEAGGEDAASPPPSAQDAPSAAPPKDPEPGPDDGEEQEAPSAEALQQMMIAAVEALLPKRLLIGQDAGAAARMSRGEAGKMGAARPRGTRGRAVGIAKTPPVPGARLDVLATLRQAAPWQRLRAASPAAASSGRLRIRKDDFRYARYRDKTGTTAIFAVDASGSAAVERLAETKGAIELLLGECYVRRDSVALVAFRGREAETLLEPTRSLVRAKRCLSSLPGGGGTPLAGGILSTLRLGLDCRRKGQSVVAVFLTDGRGNIALDGTTSRERVGADTAKAARSFRAAGVRSILIDTAQRPQPRAEQLARDLGAEYLALPRGRSQRVALEVGARMGR